jgi:hypothetical protein
MASSDGKINVTISGMWTNLPELNKHFQQIFAWTLKSRWQQQNQLLRQITSTFRSEK